MGNNRTIPNLSKLIFIPSCTPYSKMADLQYYIEVKFRRQVFKAWKILEAAVSSIVIFPLYFGIENSMGKIIILLCH